MVKSNKMVSLKHQKIQILLAKMENKPSEATKASSLRWKILRQALHNRSSNQNPKDENFSAVKHISRKTSSGFSLIPSQVLENDDDVAKDANSRNATVCYTLPIDGNPKVVLKQRVENCADLNDFEICNKYNVDNTGLVCQWPSEEVLAYFCLSHAELFRSKRVIELGSGYGLAGLVIAAATEATEVVISDGNPQVVDYIQRNVDANSGNFGSTEVKAMILHWDQEETSNLSGMFDVIVASDCTFFKEFHESLACTIKLLLSRSETSEAIFFSPRRGNSLDKFIEKIEENGMHFSITENYDEKVWNRHQGFMNEDCSWPNYEKDHCYPLLVRITL